MAKKAHKLEKKKEEKSGQVITEAMEQIIAKKVLEHGKDLTEEQRKKVVEGLKGIYIEGKTPVEALEIPEYIPNYLYKHGYDLYNLGLYQEANGFFNLLCMLEPRSARNHLAFAAANQQMGKFAIAAVNHLVAFSLDPETPLALYYAADCYLKLDDPYVSYQLLLAAAEVCGEKPIYQKLKTRCFLLVKQLKKELKIEEKIDGVPEGEKDIFSQFQEQKEKENT